MNSADSFSNIGSSVSDLSMAEVGIPQQSFCKLGLEKTSGRNMTHLTLKSIAMQRISLNSNSV